jgi:hypothetical protein
LARRKVDLIINQKTWLLIFGPTRMRLSANLIINSPTAQSTTILPLYIISSNGINAPSTTFYYLYGLQKNYDSNFYDVATVQFTAQTLRLPTRYTETAALSPTLGMTSPSTTSDDEGAILA